MRALAPKLALSAAAILLVAVALEIGARGSARRKAIRAEPSTAVTDAPPPAWRKPDFRGRDHRPFKRRLGFRVLVVGDSYTWGVGVHADDAYPARLQRALTGLQLAERPEVLAWSRPGWNTVNELRALEGARQKVRFDLMVVGFVLNDAEPSNPTHTEEVRRRHELGPGYRRHPETLLSRGLFEHSALFRFSWERLENTRQRRALTHYYRSLYRDAEAWVECREALAQLAAIARHAEAPAIFMIFPIFDSPLDHRYPYADLHREAAAAARQAGFEVLDLLPSFADIDPRRLAVQPFTDPHPNELAHRITADVLTEYMLTRKLLPPAASVVPPGSPTETPP